MSHTPGPWSVGELGVYWTDGVSVMGLKDNAICCTTRGGGEPHWDDARLIAAAPELLAACKAVAGVYQDYDVDHIPQYARKCIDVVKKATTA